MPSVLIFGLKVSGVGDDVGLIVVGTSVTGLFEDCGTVGIMVANCVVLYLELERMMGGRMYCFEKKDE